MTGHLIRAWLQQVWDSESLQCLRTLEGHEDNVRVLAVGDRYLFSGSWDKTIRVWDTRSLSCLKVGSGPLSDAVHSNTPVLNCTLEVGAC